MVFENTRQQLRQQLMEFDRIEGNASAIEAEGRQPSSTIYIYKMFLAKEKALYEALCTMRPQSQSYVGYFWAPV
jgi:hypothetical protein